MEVKKYNRYKPRTREETPGVKLHRLTNKYNQLRIRGRITEEQYREYHRQAKIEYYKELIKKEELGGDTNDE